MAVDQQLKEAQEKATEAKAWGQEKAREADQARRDLKTAQDQAETAAETQAELEVVRGELAAANGRISDLVSEVAVADKRAKKYEAKAASFDAIKSALGV